MKKIVLFSTIVVLCFLCNAQWLPIKTCTPDLMVSIQFPSAQIGYAVGYNGVIIKTTNAGLTWAMQSSGTTDRLKSVFFTDNNHGYVISDSTIYKTTNGGANWFQSSNGIYITISAIYFTDADNGYVVGFKDPPPLSYSSVYKTTNGGTDWIGIDGTNYGLKSVYFADANTGYAVGSDGIALKTTDAGNHWTALNNSPGGYLSLVYFTDINTGFIYNGSIFKTTDGGDNWNVVYSGIYGRINSMCFPTAEKGYAVGGNDHTLIINTTNGGDSWAFQYSSPYYYEVFSICFTDSYNGYVAGAIWFYDPDSNMILKTTNGGSWIETYNKPPENISIYPNPAIDEITIDLTSLKIFSGYYLEIYNIQGQLLLKQNISQTKTNIDISLLPKGICFVKVISTEGFVYGKFLKE